MSYTYTPPREPRHTDEEHKRYAPNEYRRFEIARKILGFVLLTALIVLVFFIILVYINSPNAEPGVFSAILVWSLLFLIVIAGPLAAAYQQGLSAELDNLVDDAIRKEREDMQTKVAKMQNDMESFEARIKDIKAKGNVVMAGAGSFVVIGSDISNSFNAIKNDDPALADALQTISGAVEKSGNKEAGQAWERFMKQVVGERDKTTLSALWDRVVKLVPDITNLVASVAKIASLFA